MQLVDTVHPLHDAPEFAGQAVHVPPAGPYNPALQMHWFDAEHLMHEAPEFTGHKRHVVGTVEPTFPEYMNRLQLVHSLPVDVLKVPATQAEQGPPSGPPNPALHVQLVDTLQPLHEAPELAGQAAHATSRPVVLEKVPAVQGVHAALPVAVLKVPATHAEHGPPLGPVYPALQIQAVTTVLEIGDVVFAGHARQVVILIAPSAAEYVATGHVKQVVTTVAAVVIEYVPAAQLVHAALPVAVLKVPATHAEHGPPLGPVYPALQIQEVTARLEMGELVLAGHAKQVVRFGALTVAEYVETGHGKQGSIPFGLISAIEI